MGIVAQTSNPKILESEARRENYNSAPRTVLHSHEADLTNHMHFEGISFKEDGSGSEPGSESTEAGRLPLSHDLKKLVLGWYPQVGLQTQT